MGEIREDVGGNDDRDRRADAQLEADLVRHAEHPEHFVKHGNDERAAADSEKAGENAGDESGDDDQRRKQQELAHGDAQDHGLLRRIVSDQAAATVRASTSAISASAARKAAAPAGGLIASVARCRRKARAPGTPRNKPSTWRVTA